MHSLQKKNKQKNTFFLLSSLRWNFNLDPPQGELFSVLKFAPRELPRFTPTGPVGSHEWPRATLILSLCLYYVVLCRDAERLSSSWVTSSLLGCPPRGQREARDTLCALKRVWVLQEGGYARRNVDAALSVLFQMGTYCAHVTNAINSRRSLYLRRRQLHTAGHYPLARSVQHLAGLSCSRRGEGRQKLVLYLRSSSLHHFPTPSVWDWNQFAAGCPGAPRELCAGRVWAPGRSQLRGKSPGYWPPKYISFFPALYPRRVLRLVQMGRGRLGLGCPWSQS